MTAIEIALLVLGAIIFAVSFAIPEMKSEPSKEQQKLSEAEIRKIIDREMEHVRERVDDVVDETIDYTMEKTERSLAKISNEKIMAVNEYSDTVLEEINKNHKEVMFLYDMLNDKQNDLRNTLRKAEATKEETVAAVAEATVVSSLVRQQEETVSEPVAERVPEPIFHRFAEGMDEAVLPITENVVVKEVTKAPISKKASSIKTVSKPSELGGTSSAGGSKNNNQRILEMHKEGQSNIAIAKELGLGLGEVKLVIDLFEGV